MVPGASAIRKPRNQMSRMAGAATATTMEEEEDSEEGLGKVHGEDIPGRNPSWKCAGFELSLIVLELESYCRT